jgi:hypothetical protein
MFRMTGGIEFVLRMVLFSLAGWMNQEQLKVIDYLKDENRTLGKLVKRDRIRLSVEDRLCLDKNRFVVDLGLTDDHTGFTCWFLRPTPHGMRCSQSNEALNLPVQNGCREGYNASQGVHHADFCSAP